MTLRVVGIHLSSSEYTWVVGIVVSSRVQRVIDATMMTTLLCYYSPRMNVPSLNTPWLNFIIVARSCASWHRECGRAALLCCRFPEYKKNNVGVVFFVQDLKFATTHHSSRWCHRARSLCSRLRRHSETRGVSKSLTFRPLTQKNNSYVVFYRRTSATCILAATSIHCKQR